MHCSERDHHRRPVPLGGEGQDQVVNSTEALAHAWPVNKWGRLKCMGGPASRRLEAARWWPPGRRAVRKVLHHSAERHSALWSMACTLSATMTTPRSWQRRTVTRRALSTCGACPQCSCHCRRSRRGRSRWRSLPRNCRWHLRQLQQRS